MSPDSRAVVFLRNVAIVFGLWYLGSQVGALAGLLMNQLPAYVASTARPNSFVVLRVIWVVPFAVSALASGFGAPWLLPTSRWSSWTVALGAFIVLHYSAYFTGGWRPGDLEAADRIAWPINAALLVLFFVVGVLAGRRSRRPDRASV